MNYFNYCFGPTTEENYPIIMTGDTLINSQIYHKLNITSIQVISSTCGPNTTIGYKGAIRQDSSIKKVFIVPPFSSAEEVLYDFNLQVGDTIAGYLGTTFSTMPEIVQSIDSVLVGGNYHKRWEVNALYQIYFIEGVGSTYGLIAQLPGGNISDQPTRAINCFSVNNTTLYPAIPTHCNLITSENAIDAITNQITVFPNPFSEVITIQTTLSFKSASLVIYNSFGQEVKQINTISGKSFVMPRDDLSVGVYFFRMTEANETIYAGKFVITDK